MPVQTVAEGRTATECLAVDGSLVRIRSNRTLIKPFTSIAFARLPDIGRSTELTVGPADLGRKIALAQEISIDFEFNEEFSFQSGRLLIGSGRQPIGQDGVDYWEPGPNGKVQRTLMHLAVWEGNDFSLHTHTYGGDPRVLLRVLEEFEITETPDGIVCVPAESSSAFFSEPTRLIKIFPGIGLLDIKQLTTETAKQVPRASGTRVKGGELFVHSPDEDELWFLLVGETVVCHVVPYAGTDSQIVLDLCAELDLEWV